MKSITFKGQVVVLGCSTLVALEQLLESGKYHVSLVAPVYASGMDNNPALVICPDEEPSDPT